MNRKLYWGLGVLIILLGTAFVFITIRDRAEIAQRKQDNADPQEEIAERNQPQSPQEEHPAEEHFHDGGTFHEGDPPDPIQSPNPIQTPPPSRDYKPTQIQIPEGITDPEVKKAWERLDYIANNIWEWGGVPSHRTVELIDQLMPPPDGFSGPSGHSDLEDTINLLGQLAWSGDPRAAEVVVTYLCEGRVGGNDPIDALVEIGPPAVPLLIPYLLDMEMKPSLRSRPIKILGRIAEKHHEDLGGIVEHIIIPRLEAILSEEDPDYFEGKSARESLALLK